MQNNSAETLKCELLSRQKKKEPCLQAVDNWSACLNNFFKSLSQVSNFGALPISSFWVVDAPPTPAAFVLRVDGLAAWYRKHVWAGEMEPQVKHLMPSLRPEFNPQDPLVERSNAPTVCPDTHVRARCWVCTHTKAHQTNKRKFSFKGKKQDFKACFLINWSNQTY